VLADPAPSVLLDRSAAENALEIVVAFSTAEDQTAAVKSDLIKAVQRRARSRARQSQPHAEHGAAGWRSLIYATHRLSRRGGRGLEADGRREREAGLLE